MFNSQWYNSLNKPFLAPPDSIFMPVWTILYITIFLSLIFFFKGGISKSKIKGIVFYFLQLILNFSWTFIFFGMRNIVFALFVIILMWIFIVLTISNFSRHSKLAAILLLPYLIWVSFAFYLNLGYFILNS